VLFGHGVVCYLVVGDQPVPFLERNPQLEPGQARSGATLRPGAEGQVLVGRAVGLEYLRLGDPASSRGSVA
jgi:hypothetical protein